MDSPQLIYLPKIVDERGNLSFLQEGVGCPFIPIRVFWTYNVQGGSVRGGHGYKTQNEIIVAVNGSFDVRLEYDGIEKVFTLRRGDVALFLPPRTWRCMENFSTNGIGLHLSDQVFSEDDYIRDREAINQLAGR